MLISYFSWGGNTKSIAEKIQNTTGGDMYRIEKAIAYPTDYNEAAYGTTKKQHDEATKPKLKNNGDVSGYDVIFIETSAQCYEMALAVKTFLSETILKAKSLCH